MAAQNDPKKAMLEEMMNRKKMGDKKFHSESSLQNFEEDMEPETPKVEKDPGLAARGLAGVDMRCVPPSFVLNDRPAPNSGPRIFPDFNLGHAPDCNLDPHSVFNNAAITNGGGNGDGDDSGAHAERRRTMSQPGPVSGSLLTATAARAARRPRRPQKNVVYAEPLQSPSYRGSMLKEKTDTQRIPYGGIYHKNFVLVTSYPSEVAAARTRSEWSYFL
ncbi:hypothetical protein EVAR_27782_1 [Eumeta japonica]|uniref:Uncharacterized protein n=1 Tax=Eumeta variegata TaxID=151549 RepID=A0A4C1VAL8_EUMVA|nr:hypothetical protein EVAR_27782_1 [Eumeta japonica]